MTLTTPAEHRAPVLEQPRPLLRRRGTAIALVAASVPMFMATLDNLVMTTALPVLHTELNASLEQLQWMVNAYTLSFATLMIAAATLGDRLGRRRVFIAGIAVFGGATWAAIFGVIAAFVNAIAQLSWAATYPVWSITAIVLDVLVIYALVVYGGQRD